jgi:hypothetical protein
MEFRSVARIVILDAVEGQEGASGEIYPQIEGSVFIYKKEVDLLNTFLSACRELSHIVSEFERKLNSVIANGTPSLASYIEEINGLDMASTPPITLELEVVDLLALFKVYLLLVKAALDKLIPLYSYRYYSNLKQFSDKGERFLKEVKNNGHVIHKDQFVELIRTVKSKWLDTVIDLRDEYAHYSSLKAYSSFVLNIDSGVNGLKDISKFQRPSLTLPNGTVDALKYMIDTKVQLLHFASRFISLCDYNNSRRPKRYLKCECGHEFAKKIKGKIPSPSGITVDKHIEIQVMDISRDYGVIRCPRCGRQTETDLEFWRSIGAMPGNNG